ncbi:MAG: type II toxin-antitoxin system death-on-curing family toxin [Burkholderiales bacterium]
MSAVPRWITRAAVLLLHEESIATFGGARGIRDEGLLDSALARPRNAYGYRPDISIAELAASYAFGLAKIHASVDGNKRAAFLSIGVFLAINGFALNAEQPDAIRTMLTVASGELGEHELASWIQSNLVSTESN